MAKSKTPEPLYQQYVPEEDRGKTSVSKYYRVPQNQEGLKAYEWADAMLKARGEK